MTIRSKLIHNGPSTSEIQLQKSMSCQQNFFALTGACSNGMSETKTKFPMPRERKQNAEIYFTENLTASGNSENLFMRGKVY